MLCECKIYARNLHGYSAKVVEFYVHIRSIFSCRVTYAIYLWVKFLVHIYVRTLIVNMKTFYMYVRTYVRTYVCISSMDSTEQTLINELVSLTVDRFDSLVDGHNISLQ